MSRIVTQSKLVGTKDGVQLWLIHLECDTMQDVPAATAFGSGTKIAIGSTAHVIEDNSDLQINSSGVWIQQRAGSSTYTRAEIDSMISQIDAKGAEDRAALIKQVDDGAKNLLRNTASSQVVGGVTFTVNADGTIIANGTKTNNDWLFLSTGNSLAAGTYVLSSGLAPQSDVSIRLLIATSESLGSAIMSAEGGRQVHIKQLTSDYTGLYYAIRISSGTTVNNIVFKPMLCTAADYAISPAFVPYAPTNRELYEMIKSYHP